MVCSLGVCFQQLPNRQRYTLGNSMVTIAAIGKPECQVRKASHCGCKQKYRSPDEITLLLLVRATYIWVLFFAHIPLVVNRKFNGEVATLSHVNKIH